MSGEAMVVACSSSTWAAELGMLEAQLRRRLSELLAAPAPSLRFEVGKVIREEPAAPPAEALRPATEADERRADELAAGVSRSEEHTSELQSHVNLVCRLL